MSTSRHRARIILLISILFIFASSERDTDRDINALKKSAGRVDEAVGVMTKGQLQNLTMNFGQITDTRLADPGNAPSDDFFNFRYPRKKYTGLVDDLALLFAVEKNSMNGDNGNVIDGYTSNNNEDWIAKDGSLGLTHYDGNGPHEMVTWFDGTPYLAHSDLPATWPLDENGNAFWPGYFLRDSTGAEIENEFASDRDVYCVYTDANNQQGDVIGIEIEQMAYCYGNPLAEDIQFYEFYIHNTSDTPVLNAWFGHYHDPDCSDYGQETIVLPDPLFDDPAIPDAIIQRDFDGDINGGTIPNSKGVVEDYSYGVVVLETPADLGVTDFHYYLDTGPSDDHELWPIISSQKDDPDIVANVTQYFHGANERIDDVSLITEKTDLVYIAATGPFDLLPGETEKYTIAVICGLTDADFMKNARYALKMFNNRFTGPKAPPPPTLTAVSGDKHVTLYWDDFSEHVPDPISKEIDFEGYKIYRSEDDGVTWGSEITDAFGDVIGYVPIAQYDIEGNNVSGLDSVNNALYLGDDSGLRHIFIDNTVDNGKRYAYTITAYDRGVKANAETGDPALQSLECSRGTSDAEKNFVIVTPTSSLAAQTPSSIYFSHEEGKAKYSPEVSIIDDSKLDRTEDVYYEVLFSGSPVDSYSVVKSNGDLMAKFRLNETDLRIVDGFTVGYYCDLTQGGLISAVDGTGKDVWGANQRDTTKLDATGQWLTTVAETPGKKATLDSKTSDYEIRFTETGSYAYTFGKIEVSKAVIHVPFEIWDVSANRGYQVNCQVKEVVADSMYQYSEPIYIVATPYGDPSHDDQLVADRPADFPYVVTFWGKDENTLLPETGQSVLISSYSPPLETDKYRIEFEPSSIKDKIVDDDLEQVRVVPNPYIVTAEWEFRQNVRQIRFMYLPPVCDISIYTLSGVKVKELHHTNGTGDEPWDLTSDFGEDLAFGVYVYVVSTGDAKKIGKFALIK